MPTPSPINANALEASSADTTHHNTETLSNDDGFDQPTLVTALTGSPLQSNLDDEPLKENDTTFGNVKIPDDEWKRRIQDGGCAISELKKKTYKKNKIPGYGPKEAPIYYFDLTSVAIDWLKNFKSENQLGRGWNKIPKNPTDVKMKIVERLLAMRKYNSSTGLYDLEQMVLLGQLQNVWGYAQPCTQLHHNDRLRLFEVI